MLASCLAAWRLVCGSLSPRAGRFLSAPAGGKLRAAKVAKRKGPEGKLLSAGYGFVEFSSEEVAKEVIKQLQV